MRKSKHGDIASIFQHDEFGGFLKPRSFAYRLFLGWRQCVDQQAAKDLQDAVDSLSRLIRAFVTLSVDQFNVMRTRDRDRSADVAAATSLADLKTRWAARSALNDLTYAQAKTAIQTNIDAE